MKIVVFDLDETLGYFVEFSMFLDCIVHYLKQTKKEYQINQHEFNALLDLYPEFIRPNIIEILSYLKNKKQTRDCKKLMIYTNNQGPRIWANQLISFFESKIDYKLVDQIIGAFKINGRRVELCRTSHDKSHRDLIRCTKIPRNTEICFIDDVYHPEMVDKNIYYINLKPYVHDLDIHVIIDRFSASEIGKQVITDQREFKEFIVSKFKEYNYTCVEKKADSYEIDKILGKKIMSHLHKFFAKTTNNSTKRTHNKSKHNKTLKNRQI